MKKIYSVCIFMVLPFLIACNENHSFSLDESRQLLIVHSHPLKTIFQHKACTDKLYADSFYKVQKNSHSSFEVICCRS